MNHRQLGKTGFNISEISLGTRGAEFNHEKADKILEKTAEGGVNFIDTAEVYSEGLSETQKINPTISKKEDAESPRFDPTALPANRSVLPA